MAERVNIPNSVQVTQCLRPDSFPPDNSAGWAIQRIISGPEYKGDGSNIGAIGFEWPSGPYNTILFAYNKTIHKIYCFEGSEGVNRANNYARVQLGIKTFRSLGGYKFYWMRR